MLLETVFLASASLVVYHHAVYPPLLRALANRARKARPADALAVASATQPPSVTIVVPAHNEGRYIAAKIQNILDLDYPKDRLNVVIACDGCTDDTVANAEAESRNAASIGVDIAVVVHDVNRGKVAVINEAIAASTSDLVVLTDVSAVVDSDALIRVARQFERGDVGVVCATYRLGPDAPSAERLYWKYQTAIKADEAALEAPMGAHGAFYAFRRDLWRPLAPDTINDDFILPMDIVARGWRAIYDTSVEALETESSTTAQDFKRRRRISAGNLQQVLRLPQLANPFRPALAYVFLSGKALRAFAPWLIVIALLSSIILAIHSLLWTVVAGVQVGSLFLAGVVYLRRSVQTSKLLLVLTYLAQGHLAGLVGTVEYLARPKREGWKRVNNDVRPAEDLADFVHPMARAGKRTLDIVVSLIGMVGFALLFVPISIAIKLDSPGPLLYRQLRVGRAGARSTKLFHLAKFRTMRSDAESKTGAVWATARDPRVTRVGRFLRKTRLDELPQFINVLRGDMSIVGPRPERPQFFQKLESNIPFYVERTFGLKPGITGLAQVSQGYDASIEDVRSKTLFDHAYAMRIASPLEWLKTDLSIIFRTFAVVLLGKGQ